MAKLSFVSFQQVADIFIGLGTCSVFHLVNFSVFYLIRDLTLPVCYLIMKQISCILEHSSVQSRLDSFVLFVCLFLVLISCQPSLYNFELKVIKCLLQASFHR